MNTINKHKFLRLFAIFLLLLFCITGNAQRFINFSGFVLDAQSQEPISFAFIQVPSVEKNVDSISENGSFQLSFYAFGDSLSAYIQAEGYRNKIVRFKNQDYVTENIQLERFEGQIQEVSIIQEKNMDESLVTSLEIKQVKLLPSFLGEPDILKTLTYKSGFLSVAENAVGLSVRGGEPSQNMLLLDDAPIYNVSHLFGFLSSINGDVVNGLQAYKGGFSADKGGRIASFIQIETKDGSPQKHEIMGGVGILDGRLSASGPLFSKKLTYIVGARRTYLDAFVPYLNKKLDTELPSFSPIPDYYFGDLNAKLTYKPNLKNKISILAFAANDQLNYKNLDFGLGVGWQNRVASINWRHFFTEQQSLNTTVSTSHYAFEMNNKVPNVALSFGSNIKNYRINSQYAWQISKDKSLQVGLSASFLDSNIGVLNSEDSNLGGLDISVGEHRMGTEAALFSSYEFSMGTRSFIRVGTRFSGYQGDGKIYANVEPRLRYEFRASKKLVLFGSFDRMAQYVHQLYGSGFSLPVDIWYPSTSNLAPQRSNQVAIGASYVLPRNFTVKYEVYYKQMDNQPELIDGALLLGTGSLDEQTVLGFGRAFAACEFEIERKSDKLQAWLSYTYAKTSRYGYASINGGQPFSPRQDVRHNLSLAVVQQLSNRLSFSTTFSYRSGLYAWFPKQRASFQNTGNGELAKVVPIYQDRNNVRLPAYLRWDLGLIYTFGKDLNQNLTLSVLNVTNRRNPYFYYIKPKYRDVLVNGDVMQTPEGIEVKGVRLFPILPALTWNFKF